MILGLCIKVRTVIAFPVDIIHIDIRSEVLKLEVEGQAYVRKLLRLQVDVFIVTIVLFHCLRHFIPVQPEILAHFNVCRVTVPSPSGEAIANHHTFQVQALPNLDLDLRRLVMVVNLLDQIRDIYSSIRLTWDIQIIRQIFRELVKEAQQCFQIVSGWVVVGKIA